MKKTNLIAGAILLLAACTPKTQEAISTAPVESFPTASVSEGSALYAANCGSCHKLKKVEDYSHERWMKIVPDMSRKAKMDATQEAKILDYVLWKSPK